MIAQSVAKLLILALFLSSCLCASYDSQDLVSFEYSNAGKVRRSKRLASNNSVQIMRGQLGANYLTAQQLIDSPKFYAGLQGDLLDKEAILIYLQTPSSIIPENKKIAELPREYFRMNQFDLYEALMSRFSFSDYFDSLLALVFETFAAGEAGKEYFRVVFRTQAVVIRRKLGRFWKFLLAYHHGRNCIDGRCYEALQILESQLDGDKDIKSRCSYYLLNHVIGEARNGHPYSERALKCLLDSTLIDPNCGSVTDSARPESCIPVSYQLLGDVSLPEYYYKCFLGNRRFDVNRVIASVPLLGRDPESASAVEVKSLPLFYHAIILMNLRALLHISFNRNFNLRRTIHYLPNFLLWLLRFVLRSRNIIS